MTDSADVGRPAPMPPDRWATLEPLVDAALELPPERRARYFADLKGQDPALAAEVQRFVDECDRPDARLDDAAPARFAYLIDDTAPLFFPAGTVLCERYRIEREIDRGGMAIVYLATDLKLHNRPVALKVRQRDNLTAQDVSRFVQEILLNAKLLHPNIVPIYDADEFEGQAFFVMPQIDGESLRERLARAIPPCLPITEALRIGIDIARALEFAHAKGIFHRDVKPANLLLSNGVAMLADFGIAHAERTDARISETGVRVGTPAYMSPEQYLSPNEVGSRTDIYSLGCVLYEMIAGVRPTPVIRRLVEIEGGADPVRPLRELRSEVSPRLEECVARALAVKPEDRMTSATELARSLGACAHEYGVRVAPWKRLYWRWPKRVGIAAGVIGIGAIAGSYALVRPRVAARQTAAAPAPVSLSGEPFDTSRIVVLPFSHRGTAGGAGDEDRLRDAIARWRGVDPVDRLETRNALVGRDTTNLTASVARDIGRAVRAARYVSGDITLEGNTQMLRAGLYDARTGVALARAAVAVGPTRRRGAFESLADALLFPEVPESTVVRLGTLTRSRPALQAYVRSRAAIDAWDLPRADSALTEAVNADERFALAYMWLAQVRSWRDLPSGAWEFAAHRAATARVSLNDHDRRVADALTAMAAHDTASACRIWEGLTRGPDSESDFAAWYATARCDYGDFIVVRNVSSPSGWAFRTSYQHATQAFKRAFEILPAIHREFRSSWYTSLKRTLRTQGTQLRFGRAQRPDTGRFAAYPSWSRTADTLEFIPYPIEAFEQGRADIMPPTAAEAVRHQREVFRDIATTWRAAFRPSADALLALAVALDELGDSTAIDSVHLARRLAEDAGDPGARMLTGAEEVWMRIKRGVPNDPRGLAAARALADTLLRSAAESSVDSQQSLALSSLAALTGHVHLSARYARGSADLVGGPVALEPTIRGFRAFAALGAPLDSIRVLAHTLRMAPVPEATAGERARWMARAVTIAFPVYQDSSVRVLARGGDYLAVAENAWLDHDTATIRRRLGELHDARRVAGAEELKLEALYPEAWLLASIGDSARALEWITPTLDALSHSSTENLQSAVAGGALVHAMVLRAELANRMGRKAEAAQWARAVLALWSDADDVLQPIVKAMKRLAR